MATIKVHPLIKNFNNYFSFANFRDDADAITFLEDVGLIPARDSKPPQCCGIPMKVEELQSLRLGWRWRCSTKPKITKGAEECQITINPETGTFFDGSASCYSIRDILFIIFQFVLKVKVTDVCIDQKLAHLKEGGSVLSTTTVSEYYSYCREITEVVASHSDILLGGEGKTIRNETFLTKRKYNRGSMTEQMTIVVLGLYCPKDKIGLFFKVNSRSKTDLWPYIVRYTHPNCARVCTDSAHQHSGVGECVHLTTNHRKGEFVSKPNPINTIDHLENQDKLLKKAIVCRNSTKRLHQFMAMHFYWKHVLGKYHPEARGERIQQFLNDIKRVYPPMKDGVMQDGLQLREIDPPSSLQRPDLAKANQGTSSRECNVEMSIEAEIDHALDVEEDHFEAFLAEAVFYGDKVPQRFT